MKRGTAMSYYSERVERITAAGRRALMILAFFAAVFVFSGTVTFAEGDVVLTVSKDGELIREFTQNDLEQIAADEDDKTYTFSAWNTHPTFDKITYSAVNGPTVSAILDKAGAIEDISDTATVSFSDGAYKASFTIYQLIKEPRYYYPNGGMVDQLKGTVPTESYDGAVEVEPVIYLTADGDKVNNILCIGQAAPNDENKPAFVKHLKTIEVKTNPAPQCTIPSSEPANDSICKIGQEITLKGTGAVHEYIYYTLDGSEPDYGSTLYNSGMEQGIVTKPVLKTYGTHIIRVKVKGYGKQDSKTATFTYHVMPDRPAVTLKAGKKKIKVSWKKIKDADGYVVYRSTKKTSGFKAVKTIKNGSTITYTNKKLKRGKRYYYKVRAYICVDGKKVFSMYSAVKKTKAK